MKLLLWMLQVLLAAHTAVGAAWKLSHSPEQTMPSLKAIPVGVWQAMAVVELLCCLCLILPVFNKRLAILAPVAVVFIVAEMLLYTGLYVRFGNGGFGPVVYWLVVATVCAFVAYGRLAAKRP
jgi:K+ transporter